jgi:predicted RNase H-like HicB family nuclease
MKTVYTAIIQKIPKGGFVGQIKEVPEVLCQGKTVNELIKNLVDALKLFICDRLPQTWSIKKIYFNS